MPQYEIIVRCQECNREHPVLMKIHLDHGPKAKQSVAEFFHGRLMPPQVKTIRIIAGFPGGGGVDAEARMMARFLGASPDYSWLSE